MYVKILFSTAILFVLYFASIQDLLHFEVENCYSYLIATISIIYLVVTKSFVAFDLVYPLIMFISTYIVYLISNLTGRNALGGADVRIFTVLAIFYKEFSISIMFIACVIDILYISYLKTKNTDKKITEIYAPLVPPIFLSVLLNSALFLYML